MTKWTPELLDRVRILADQGHSAKQTASLICVNVGVLSQYAGIHRISFKRMAAKNRPRVASDIDVSTLPPEERLLHAARVDLAHQIALARAEAKTAPIYRGGNFT